jgi:hypothetical protein
MTRTVQLSAALRGRGRWIRYTVPLGVTAAALAVALSQTDPGALMIAAGELRAADLAIVFIALTAGALLASLRLQVIAHDLGYPLRMRDAVAALSLGQIAGSLFFQIVGQTAARGAFLKRRGMPLSGTLIITGYERLAALLVSVLMALVGAWTLFGHITIDLERGGAEFARLVIGLVAVLVTGAAFAWGEKASSHLRRVAGPQATGRIARVVALSTVIQLSTMAAYMVAAKSLAPAIGIGTMAAAAAVVMLAAALPISLAGWGIRELSAIYALGIIGLPKEKALVVAVVIGAAALLVVAVLAVSSLLVSRRDAAPAMQTVRTPVDYAVLLAWSLPVIAATAVFFQIYVPLARAPLNVNLADPVVLIGAALFGAIIVRTKRLPSWRLHGINLHLALMTGAIAAAFLVGWVENGWSGWAFTNRLAGWLVLLAYLATGALIVRAGAAAGLDALTWTFAVVALTIVLIDAIIFAAVATGLQVPIEIIRYRIEGFAQNANAFALQLLFATAVILSRQMAARAQISALAVALLGLWLTGSKAGLIALAVVLAAAIVLGAVRAGRIGAAVVLAAVVVLVINWLPDLLFTATQAVKAVAQAVTDLFCDSCSNTAPVAAPAKLDFSALSVAASGYEASSAERAASLRAAWQMFLAHPLAGAGLGAFLEQYRRMAGAPLVIHSTPLWLLAETGAIGFLVFAAPFIRILSHGIAAARQHERAAQMLVLVMIGFGIMAIVHELLYQRAFWLLLGAALALPRSEAQR